MPKERPNLSQKLRELVSMFPDFEIVDSVLRCKYCCDRIPYDSKRGSTPFTRHLKSQKHQKKSQNGLPVLFFPNDVQKPLENNNVVSMPSVNLNGAVVKPEYFNEAVIKQEYFNMRLRTALIEAKIPFFKLKHPSFRSFLEEFTKFKIPDESTLRKPLTRSKSDSNLNSDDS